MNGEAVVAESAYDHGEVVDALLGLGEYDALGVALLHDLLEHALQPILLVVLLAHLDDLLDVRVGGEELRVADGDVNVVADEVLGQLAHLLGPRGAEHGRLAVGSDLLDDLAYLGLEAHVEHAVGLVEHQVRALGERHRLVLEEVEQASGRGDADLGAASDLLLLWHLGRAAIDAHVAYADGRAELLGDRLNLNGELARRRQHEAHRSGQVVAAAAKRAQVLAVLHDVYDHGQEEAERLARAGLGDADYVVAAEQGRPTHGLDGRGRRVLGVLDAAHHAVGYLELVEAEYGPHVARARDRDAVLGQEVAELARVALRRHVVELLVERPHRRAIPCGLAQHDVVILTSHAAATASVSATAIAAAATATIATTAAAAAAVAAATAATTTTV